ncbi:hypothetical protein McanCB21832_008103 [Microsporum canis]
MHVVADRLSADDEADSMYATEVLRCPAKIKGRTVGGMIDIGSEVNVMSRELAEYLGLRIIPNPNCTIVVQNKQTVLCTGCCLDMVVDVLGVEVATPFLILKAGDE